MILGREERRGFTLEVRDLGSGILEVLGVGGRFLGFWESWDFSFWMGWRNLLR